MNGIVAPSLSSWWGPALAFVAGTVSFASPCVVPLVPGYVSFITGGSVPGTGGPSERRSRSCLGAAVLFVLGFASVFTLLGAASGTLVPLLRGSAGRNIAGMTVAAVGLLMIASASGRGARFLAVERRPFLHRLRPSRVVAIPLGMAFAAGWTPCIGPVLAAILALAAPTGSARAAALLFSYSLGLGVPFVLIGLGAERLVRRSRALERYHAWVVGVAGSVLVVIGTSMGVGAWTRIVAPFGRFTPGL